MGQPLLSELIAEHKKNPPKELHETKEITLPPGVHGRFIEAVGGHVDVRIPSGIHGRLAHAVVR